MRRCQVRTHLTGALLFLALAWEPAPATTIHVPSQHGLQDGVNLAAPGDTVMIESGYYVVTSTVALGSGITVRSECGVPASVTISGSNERRVLRANSVSDVTLFGLTIRNGNVGSRENGAGLYCANSELLLEQVDFRGNGRAYRGAGLYCSSSEVRLVSCTFESNVVGTLESTQTTWSYRGSGGGAYATDGSTVVATDVTFDSNHTWYEGAGLAVRGEGTSAELTGCVFIDNTTSTHEGYMGREQQGAALSVREAEVVVEAGQFLDNWSTFKAGAVMVDGLATATFDGCAFTRCEAGGFGGAMCIRGRNGVLVSNSCFLDNFSGNGGAVHVISNSTPAEFSHCIFAGNRADDEGGAMYVSGCPVSITNCTLYGNSSPNAGNLLYLWDVGVTLVANSIVSFGTDGPAVHCQGGASPEFTHCCVFGNADGDSLCGQYAENLFEDPLFCSTRSLDLSLCSNSICLPSGNPWGELIGAVVEGCGPCGSPVQEASWGSIKALYRDD